MKIFPVASSLARTGRGPVGGVRAVKTTPTACGWLDSPARQAKLVARFLPARSEGQWPGHNGATGTILSVKFEFLRLFALRHAASLDLKTSELIMASHSEFAGKVRATSDIGGVIWPRL